MVNLADILRDAGHGNGLDALSRQYGLDPAQTSKVIEAVLPAFTLAFQRMVLNPSAFADFTRSVTSGAYAPFFDNPGQSHAATSGAALVEQLFRSPEGSRQVAAQTAALAGIGVQVMQQLMPILAATLVGGMFRYATVEGFAGLLRQWGDALKSASEQLDPPKPQDPWSAWLAAAGQMMGLRPAAPQRPKPSEPGSVLDAWVALVGTMAGMAVQPGDGAAPSPTRVAAPSGLVTRQEPDVEATAANGELDPEAELAPPAGGEEQSEPNPFEAMSQMFESGREMHAQQVAAVQSILDNVWGPVRTA